MFIIGSEKGRAKAERMNLISTSRPSRTGFKALGLLTAAAMLWLGASFAVRSQPQKSTQHILAQGKYIASMCTTCHQPDKSFEGIPRILGYDADKMYEMMMEYKDSIERHEVMENIAKSLSTFEIRALSLYLASLKAQGRSM